MKGLSIGGAGFLGRAVAQIDWDCLTVLDCSRDALDRFQQDVELKSKAVCADMLSDDFNSELIELLREADVVLYLAAVDHKAGDQAGGGSNFGVQEFVNEMQVGVYGAIKVLEIISELCRAGSQDHCKKVILFGSDLGVIAPNQNLYRQAGLDFRKPVNYSAVKFALLGVMKYYAAELAQHEVAVNMVSPSGVLAEDNVLYNPMKSVIPAGRNCRVDDLVSPIDFLCSASAFVTGQNIIVDGGRTIW